MSDAIDARLRALDPSPADRRPRVAETDWGRGIAAAVTATPARRRGRGRRWAGVAAATGAVAAIAALMAVLIVSTGGEDPAPATTEVVLVATPAPGGPTLDAEGVEGAAAVVRARGETLGVDGLAATADGTAIVVDLPRSAPSDLLPALTAPGELAIYPSRRATVGRPLPSLDAAVRQAQRAAGVAVRGGDRDALPAGFGVIRRDGVRLGDPARIPSTFTVVRGEPALTEADVAEATLVDDGPRRSVRLSFTDSGAAAFRDLTRALARDGALTRTLQPMDVVLDGRLLADPVVDFERNPIGLDGRDGLVIEVPSERDAAALAAQLASGPLAMRLTPVEPTVAVPPPLAGAPYLGIACNRTSDPGCDLVGLSVTLASPATDVRATIEGTTGSLDDPTWSGPARDGTRTVFAGFLDVPGLVPDSPSWIGDPPIRTRVTLEVSTPDGVETVTTDLVLRSGWG